MLASSTEGEDSLCVVGTLLVISEVRFSAPYEASRSLALSLSQPRSILWTWTLVCSLLALLSYITTLGARFVVSNSWICRMLCILVRSHVRSTRMAARAWQHVTLAYEL